MSGPGESIGTPEKPVTQLEQARDCIRAMKKAGTLPPDGITVWIHGGVYERPKTFELSEQDSGSAEAPIVYRAWEREEPILTLSRSIDPSSWKPIAESEHSRLHPHVSGKQLVELEVSQLGLEPLKPLSDYQMGIALFADGRRQPLAQWPDRDENVLDVNQPGWTTCHGSRDAQSFYFGKGGDPQNDRDAANQVDHDGTNRSARWKSSIDQGRELWLRGFWRAPWIPEPIRMVDIDPEERWIQLARSPGGGMGSKYTSQAGDGYRRGSGTERWFAVNMLEELNRPGEWILDFQAQKIYLYPPGPLDGTALSVSCGSERGIRLSGCEHVAIEGLVIEGCNDNAIQIERSSDVAVAGCTVRNCYNGIEVAQSRDFTIQSNDISAIGHSAVLLEDCGDREKLIRSEATFRN
ncbi:MAG: right-handed parallel beta-helix repeat-containing protein, partial [Planctomycetota bacterium]